MNAAKDAHAQAMSELSKPENMMKAASYANQAQSQAEKFTASAQ